MGVVLRDILNFSSIPKLPLFPSCGTEVQAAWVVRWVPSVHVMPCSMYNLCFPDSSVV